MADNNHRDHRGPHGAPAHPSSGEEDPLVELARIVSEDGGFYKPKRNQGTDDPVAEDERDAFSPELEAEILEELRASPAQSGASEDQTDPDFAGGPDFASGDGYGSARDAEIPQTAEPETYEPQQYRDESRLFEPPGGVVDQSQADTGHGAPPMLPGDPYWQADTGNTVRAEAGHEQPVYDDVSDGAGLATRFAPDQSPNQALGQTPGYADAAYTDYGSPQSSEPASGPAETATGDYYEDEYTEDSADTYLEDEAQPAPGHEEDRDHSPPYAGAATEIIAPQEPQDYLEDEQTSLADTLDPDFRQALEGQQEEITGSATVDYDELPPQAGEYQDDGDHSDDYYGTAPSADPLESQAAAPEAGNYVDSGGLNIAAASGHGETDFESHQATTEPAQDSTEGQEGGRVPEPDVFADTLGELAPDESVYEETADKGRTGLTAERAGYKGLEFAEPRKSRIGMFAIAAVLAVMIIGGGLAATMGLIGGGGSDGTPPVIRADQSDVKQAPDQIMANAEEDGVGQAVFDSVSGQVQKTEEKLIDNAEEPREVARIILPDSGTDASGRLIDDGVKMEARLPDDVRLPENGPKFDPIGPRKVRTVTVKPDGTIVQNSAPVIKSPATTPPADSGLGIGLNTAMTPGSGESPAVGSGTTMAAPTPVKVRTIDISGSGSSRPSGATELQSGNSQTVGPVNAATGGSEIAIAALESGDPASGQSALTGAGAVPKPRPGNGPTIQPVQTRRDPPPQPAIIRAAPQPQPERPVDLLASAPTAAAPAPPVVRSGNAFVQLSSQRSAGQAQSTFRGLQRRYPQLLSGYEPNIQRAEIAGKGTYFRVRVGPLATRDAASQLCNQIKASGGSCYVP